MRLDRTAGTCHGAIATRFKLTAPAPRESRLQVRRDELLFLRSDRSTAFTKARSPAAQPPPLSARPSPAGRARGGGSRAAFGHRHPRRVRRSQSAGGNPVPSAGRQSAARLPDGTREAFLSRGWVAALPTSRRAARAGPFLARPRSPAGIGRSAPESAAVTSAGAAILSAVGGGSARPGSPRSAVARPFVRLVGRVPQPRPRAPPPWPTTAPPSAPVTARGSRRSSTSPARCRRPSSSCRAERPSQRPRASRATCCRCGGTRRPWTSTPWSSPTFSRRPTSRCSSTSSKRTTKWWTRSTSRWGCGPRPGLRGALLAPAPNRPAPTARSGWAGTAAFAGCLLPSCGVPRLYPGEGMATRFLLLSLGGSRSLSFRRNTSPVRLALGSCEFAWRWAVGVRAEGVKWPSEGCALSRRVGRGPALRAAPEDKRTASAAREPPAPYGCAKGTALGVGGCEGSWPVALSRLEFSTSSLVFFPVKSELVMVLLVALGWMCWEETCISTPTGSVLDLLARLTILPGRGSIINAHQHSFGFCSDSESTA